MATTSSSQRTPPERTDITRQQLRQGGEPQRTVTSAPAAGTLGDREPLGRPHRNRDEASIRAGRLTSGQPQFDPKLLNLVLQDH